LIEFHINISNYYLKSILVKTMIFFEYILATKKIWRYALYAFYTLEVGYL